jgi:putative spermidine/putrescine transport system substrate-binding protein
MPKHQSGKAFRLAGGVAAVALAVAACGTSSDTGDAGSGSTDNGSVGNTAFSPPDLPMLDSLGPAEDELNILDWPGYAEDGSTDPKVDWVTPFEKKTGCQVNIKDFGTSDEAVSLMKTGEYDVVSASGDASLRLIAAGDVEPVNTDLVPNYADVAPFLKDKPWNSVDGQMYGIPHAWGANVLMYNSDVVSPAPTSWSVVFDGASKYKGKVTAYDSPIYIADAALYLMKHNRDLGIKDPYALDEDQLAAAVDLLKEQRASIGEYWPDALKEISGFKSGSSVVGTAWQYNATTLEQAGQPVKTLIPEEGSTGWSDTWMVATDSPHKNCAYMWMDYIVSPKVNAEATEWFGEAPANLKACQYAADKNFCATYHAQDAKYASKPYYWTTPIEQCLDGRTDVKCTDYGDWTAAWTDIKG